MQKPAGVEQDHLTRFQAKGHPFHIVKMNVGRIVRTVRHAIWAATVVQIENLQRAPGIRPRKGEHERKQIGADQWGDHAVAVAERLFIVEMWRNETTWQVGSQRGEHMIQVGRWAGNGRIATPTIEGRQQAGHAGLQVDAARENLLQVAGEYRCVLEINRQVRSGLFNALN